VSNGNGHLAPWEGEIRGHARTAAVAAAAAATVAVAVVVAGAIPGCGARKQRLAFVDGDVRYGFRAVIAFPAPQLVISTTGEVDGGAVLQGRRLVAAHFAADVRTLRPGIFFGLEELQDMLDADRFPLVHVELADPVVLPSSGSAVVASRWIVRLHGRARGARARLKITRTGSDTVAVAGHLAYQRQMFGLRPYDPSNQQLSPDQFLDFHVVFMRPGSKAPVPKRNSKRITPHRAPLARQPGALVVSLDTADGRGSRLYRLNESPPSRVPILPGPKTPGVRIRDTSPSVAGDTVVFVRSVQPQDAPSSPERIFRADLAGTGLRPLTRAAASADQSPSLSQDGQSVAFVRWSSGGAALWTIKSDGSAVHELVHLPGFGLSSPSFSPDGRTIVFAAFRRASGGDLFLVGRNGRHLLRLTRDAAYDYTPHFATDGQHVVFGRDGHIFVMTIDGRELRQLTHGRGRDASPVYSPDGRWIAFLRVTEPAQPQPPQLMLMRADGSRLGQLPVVGATPDPAWVR
jgi:WD40-like Beta Propeller Repeat